MRKLSSSGIITTIAGDGSGSYGGDGGSAMKAAIEPRAVAVDLQGNLFIAETTHIRKISTAGIISTVAGTGTFGYSGDGGSAPSAQIMGGAIAVDAEGNILLSGLDRIRRISVAGIITTVAGGGEQTVDGVAASTAQIAVSGLAVDATGTLFFSDFGSFRVRQVSANGIISTIAGNGTRGYSGDGLAASRAQLIPAGIATDQVGNVFIADQPNHRIRRISRDGTIATVAGTGAIGYSGDGGPATRAQLNSSASVACDGRGNVYIADAGNHRIRRIAPDGIITTLAGTGTPGFSGDGGPAISARLSSPSGIAVDASGNVFISDTANNRLRRVSLAGIITTVAGNGTNSDSGDGGPASVAALNQPYGLALDARSNIWIAEPFSNKVRKITASGTITTFAGSGEFGYAGDDGPAVTARLYSPYGVAVDSRGNLYIADTYNFRIRAVSETGVITTIAGTGTYGYSGDGGPATAADMDYTLGVATDAQGSLRVSTGNAVRLLQPSEVRVWVAAVVGAASQRVGPISPGKIVVLYGQGLGPDSLVQGQPVDGIYPKQVAGTTVLIGGIAAPILYSSATQVAAIVPYGIASPVAAIVVNRQESTSVPLSLPVTPTSPALFTLDQSGTGMAAAINAQLGSINSSMNPVRVGTYISLYATGEGQTAPAGVDGKIARSTSLPTPVETVTATVDGIPAEVQYAGAAPGLVAGVMQVNLKIPNGVRQYSAVPVVLQVGSSSTPTIGAALIFVGGL